LDVQEAICNNIASDKGWTLAHKPWKESFSGRKNRRPMFEEILAFLDKNPGEVSHYIFRSIDRFTRGGSFAYETMKRALAARGVEMVDSYGIIQPTKNTLEDLGFEYEWSKSSPSEIAEVVVASSAKQEVTNILTRLIGQEIRLTQRGYKMRAPQDGYLNEKVYVEGKKRTIQVPDPERARFFVEMFALRASGQLTDKEIVAQINAMGYRSKIHNRWDSAHERIIAKTGGKPLTVKRFQEIIKRPIYCGIVYEKWTRWQPIKAQYDGLVSIATFNAANRGKVFVNVNENGGLEMLYDYQPLRVAHRRTRNNPLFPFKNVVLCPLCKKPLVGSSPKGRSGQRFPTYHCSRNHKYFGIKKSVLEANMKLFIRSLHFHPEVVRNLDGIVLHRYHDRQSNILNAAAAIGRTVADLEAQKAQTVQAFKLATSDLMRQELEKEAEELKGKIEVARSQRNRLEVTEDDLEGFVRDVKNVMEHPSILLEDPINIRQQQALYSLVFEEFPTYDEIVNGTAKLSWIFYVSSESTTPESALVHLRGLEWNTIESTIVRWREVSFFSFHVPRS
jgi:site-specific DNA recombinase